MKIPETVAARYWARVDKTPGQGPEGDCWQWTGAMRPDGYPSHMMISGVRVRVSHVALNIAGVPKPDPKLGALHSCDNHGCVRADHLRWGTHPENVADRLSRWNGRGRTFNPDEVRMIRASPERHCDLARKFGVSDSCICNIRKRVTHKHVE